MKIMKIGVSRIGESYDKIWTHLAKSVFEKDFAQSQLAANVYDLKKLLFHA